MRITVRFISCFFILLISLSFLGMTSFANQSDLIKPTSVSDLETKAKERFYYYMNTHTSGFSLTYQNDQRNFLANTYRLENNAISPYQINFTKDQFTEFMESAGNDYTSICLKEGNSFGMNMSIKTTNNKITEIKTTYTLVWGESLSQTQQVESFAQKKVSELCNPDISDYDNIKALHDFVVNTYSYDTDYKNYYPYEIITTGKGVCQAYAGLMYQLLKKAGYESRIITKDSKADGVDHAWNLVKIDDAWYHIDATWDDPIPSNGVPILRHDYFLKGDAFMLKNHVWNRAYYPAAPFDFSKSSVSKSTRPSSNINSVTKSEKSSTISIIKSGSSSVSRSVSQQINQSTHGSTTSEELSSSSKASAVIDEESSIESRQTGKEGKMILNIQNNIIYISGGAAFFVILTVIIIIYKLKKY